MDHPNDEHLIDQSTVRDRLDVLVRAGRLPAEAVGEELFVKNKQDDMAALSRDAREELDEIFNEWLREKTGDESVTAHRFVADTYASFLTDRVTFDIGTHVPSQIEAAWREWRAQAERS